MKAKITPFLLFNNEAEAAANLYVSVFNGKLLNVEKYPENGPMPSDMVMTASFEILGTSMVALNWGQEAKYTESISFAIEADTQEEVDHYWNALFRSYRRLQMFPPPNVETPGSRKRTFERI